MKNNNNNYNERKKKLGKIVFGLLPNYIVEKKFWVAIQSLYCRDLRLVGIGKCIAIHYVVLQAGRVG